ncbi:hypothetical protein BREV_BREV_03567 [Brevundimonas mediterranea]|uniref:Uncharacterized protein n=1 Tax=Brevundimonas mediterranea TaxID=74329 RepID=A0A7Z8Y1W6_9CAUL|nr:hypothetical protein BREV_BREV_03567 [Brevundimonas mediterranea]
MLLGPFDEVGHDQEIAGEAHLLDDADLPFQPAPVFRLGHGGGDLAKAHLQPLARLVRQFVGLGPPCPRVEPRQNGRMGVDQEGAAPGDVDGVVAGLGQVGEQVAHRLGRLEPVFAGDAAAVFLAGEGAVGDAQQGVVRLGLGRLGVIDVIGRDQGRLVGVGPFDQTGLGPLFVLQPVTLQLDIEAVAEGGLHRRQGGRPLARLALGEQGIDRTVGAARQQDQPLGPRHDLVPGHARFGHFARVQIGRGRQGAQVAPPGLVLDQQDHGRGLGPAHGLVSADAEHRQGAGDDGLDPGVTGVLAELQRAEQIGPVGDGHGRHARVRRQLAQLARLDRAFQQRIGRADPQMDETLTVDRFAHWTSACRASEGRPRIILDRVSHHRPPEHRKPSAGPRDH